MEAKKSFKPFVPGLRSAPVHPRLSYLTVTEQKRYLRVLAAQNPYVLPAVKMPAPSNLDFKVYKRVQEKYNAEILEYIEWAKSLWVKRLCFKALHPHQIIEATYEAEFNMKLNYIESFPKEFTRTTMIPLRREGSSFGFKLIRELISVNIMTLPEVKYPKVISVPYPVLHSCPMPRPCYKHPCTFILPFEKSVTILPLPDLQSELAQFAAVNGATAIAAEGALKCLLESDRNWILPVSVCEPSLPDGTKITVTVLGSEFLIQREMAQRRTYRAYKHMLHSIFISQEEKTKMLHKSCDSSDSEDLPDPETADEDSDNDDNYDDDEEEEDDKLFIHLPELREIDPFSTELPKATTSKDNSDTNDSLNKRNSSEDELKCSASKTPKLSEETVNVGTTFSCLCRDSTPAPRSYQLWELKDDSNNFSNPFNIIIHCAHKIRFEEVEALLEPIPEYLLGVAGTDHTQEKQMSLALSLMMRKHGVIINARLDGIKGELITVQEKTINELRTEEVAQTISGTLYSVFENLTGLVPGHYVLLHEASQGPNAMLYCAGEGTDTDDKLSLNTPLPRDEMAQIKMPLNLAPVLLPYHKHRKILPCAFTPYKSQVRTRVRTRARRPRPTNKTPPAPTSDAAQCDHVSPACGCSTQFADGAAKA